MSHASAITYLGDGVYAKVENGQIALMANSHVNPTDTIYLDPVTTRSLLKYVDIVKESGVLRI